LDRQIIRAVAEGRANFAAISIPAADTLSRVDLSGIFLRRAKFQPEIESGVAGVRVVKHAGATSFRATSRDYARGAVKFFFTATVGAEGGSNFLAAQINPGNCGHDNYRPMARSSVTTTPSSRPAPDRPARAD